MTEDADLFVRGAEASFARLSPEDRIAVGLKLIALLDDALDHCRGRRWLDALRRYGFKLACLATKADEIKAAGQPDAEATVAEAPMRERHF
jgi:hypothetical protein